MLLLSKNVFPSKLICTILNLNYSKLLIIEIEKLSEHLVFDISFTTTDKNWLYILEINKVRISNAL